MRTSPVSIASAAIIGVHAVTVLVQATIRGQGSPRILGQVDPVVREAYPRILTAFDALGLPPLRGTPILNLAPADIRKSGAGFDLPIALALAGAAGLVPRERLARVAALGEVSLEGEIMPVRGAVPLALGAGRDGRTEILLSHRDAALASYVPGIDAIAAHSLADAIGWLRGEHELQPARPAAGLTPHHDVADLAELRGHHTPKTALLVAAAGQHNLLFVGPPGSGKSALLQRLPGLMPPPTPQESLEILAITTLEAPGHKVGLGQRPLRSPHHSSSAVSLLGGGPQVRPGEVTLAHRGILFLDELPEFRRESLEGLRQPVEDAVVTIGRATGTVQMPAAFLLVAAMNPCPCGYHGHPRRPCTCTPGHRRRYRGRVSGPLLDRFDLLVEVPALDAATLRAPAEAAWSTAALTERVRTARERQLSRARRLGCPPANARITGETLLRALQPAPTALATLDALLDEHDLSGRARCRLLRVARTLADLDDEDAVRSEHVLRAGRLRGVERCWHE